MQKVSSSEPPCYGDIFGTPYRPCFTTDYLPPPDEKPPGPLSEKSEDLIVLGEDQMMKWLLPNVETVDPEKLNLIARRLQEQVKAMDRTASEVEIYKNWDTILNEALNVAHNEARFLVGKSPAYRPRFIIQHANNVKHANGEPDPDVKNYKRPLLFMVPSQVVERIQSHGSGNSKSELHWGEVITTIEVKPEMKSGNFRNPNTRDTDHKACASKAHPTIFNMKKSQIPKCLQAMRSSLGNRLHTIGCLLIGNQFNMLYSDPIGTARFSCNLTEQPETFIKILIGLSTSSLSSLGFDHRFQPASVSLWTQGSEAPLPLPYELDGLNFWLDSSTRVRLQSAIEIRRGLEGRGTSVYLVAKDSEGSGEVGGREELVLKISQAPCSRPSEIELIRRAKNVIGSVAPNVFGSAVGRRCSAGPRRYFGPAAPKKDRFQSIILMERLHQLRKLSPPLYVLAFRILVRSLYKLRQVGNMLHRDVSSGNLMYRKVDGQFEVVLNDYDHAITLEPVQNTTHEVTGTWVFMAFDLVNTWPGEMIQHLVRFDIESAFYVFIWDSFMRIGQFPSILQGWREKPGSKHEVSLKSVDPKAEPLATVHPQLNKFFYRLCLAREEIWYLKMAHPEREITENMNGEFEPDFVLGILDEMKEAVRGAQGSELYREEPAVVEDSRLWHQV